MARIEDGYHHQVESEWMSEVYFVQNGWIQDGRIQDGCHHQVDWEWIREVFFVQNGGNPIWQSSRWLPSSSWVRMNDFESDWISLSQSFVQNGWIQDSRFKDGRIEDGCHHQVESEWMKWSFLVQNGGNPGWQNWQDGEWSSSWVRNELSDGWFPAQWLEFRLAEFKMVTIIKLTWEGMHFESYWITLIQSFMQDGGIQHGSFWDGRIQDDKPSRRCLN